MNYSKIVYLASLLIMPLIHTTNSKKVPLHKGYTIRIEYPTPNGNFITNYPTKGNYFNKGEYPTHGQYPKLEYPRGAYPTRQSLQ